MHDQEHAPPNFGGDHCDAVRRLEAAFESARLEGQPLGEDRKASLRRMLQDGVHEGAMLQAVKRRWDVSG